MAITRRSKAEAEREMADKLMAKARELRAKAAKIEREERAKAASERRKQETRQKIVIGGAISKFIEGLLVESEKGTENETFLGLHDVIMKNVAEKDKIIVAEFFKNAIKNASIKRAKAEENVSRRES